MPRKAPRSERYVFDFDFTVTTVGVPQPYPVPPRKPQILFRFTSADTDGRRKRRVLNLCGNAAGLKYLAAMLILTADSETYDPAFHVHLEGVPGVETDCDVTIRAPAYLEVLRSGEFTEFKGEPIALAKPAQRRHPGSVRSQASRKRKSRLKK